MAKNKNCPNCGAPYDPLEPKCPYCGTIYYDMSAIDFDKREPLYLQIRFNNTLITQKVIPQMGWIEISSGTNYGYGFSSYKAYKASESIDLNIGFRAIEDTNGTLMTIKKYGE